MTRSRCPRWRFFFLFFLNFISFSLNINFFQGLRFFSVWKFRNYSTREKVRNAWRTFYINNCKVDFFTTFYHCCVCECEKFFFFLFFWKPDTLLELGKFRKLKKKNGFFFGFRQFFARSTDSRALLFLRWVSDCSKVKLDQKSKNESLVLYARWPRPKSKSFSLHPFDKKEARESFIDNFPPPFFRPRVFIRKKKYTHQRLTQ